MNIQECEVIYQSRLKLLKLLAYNSMKTHYFYSRDYYIVEFPDEVENGITAMAIVPYTWLITDKNNMVRCMWPTHIGSDKALTRAVMNKDSISEESYKICDVTIKFKTSK